MKKIISLLLSMTLCIFSVSASTYNDDEDSIEIINQYELNGEKLYQYETNDSGLVFSIVKDDIKTDYYKFENTIYEKKDEQFIKFFEFGNSNSVTKTFQTLAMPTTEWSPATYTLNGPCFWKSNTTSALSLAASMAEALGNIKYQVYFTIAQLLIEYAYDIPDPFYISQNAQSYRGCSILYWYSDIRIYDSIYSSGDYIQGSEIARDTTGDYEWYGDPYNYSYPAQCRIAVKDYPY